MASPVLMLLWLGCSDPVDLDPPVAAEAVLSPGTLRLHADQDDDDVDGQADWSQRVRVDGEDDWARLEWDSGPVIVVLEGDGFRLWEDEQLLLDGEGRATATGSLEVQARAPGALGGLTLWPAAPGLPVQIGLEAYPMALTSVLEDSVEVFVVRAEDEERGLDNTELLAQLDALVGEQLTVIDGEPYVWDLWIQDEIELTHTMDTGHRTVVLDSIRDGRLDPWPEEALWGPDVPLLVYGEGLSSSQDAYGNLQATPWLSDEEPLGRVYFGARDGRGPKVELLDLLAQQGLQQQLTVDVSWLCVAHVDEVMAFVPDADAPRGFVVWVVDPRLLRPLLEERSPEEPLERYGRDFGYDTVGELLDDTGLWLLNEELGDTWIDPLVEELTTALSLEEGELLAVPGLFDEWTACSGRMSAVMPNLVNLSVVTSDGEPVVVVPDPHLHGEGEDPVLSWLTAQTDVRIEAVEDWDTYHLNLGQVHCGTAVRREAR